jgi:hypothetical protein
MIGPTALLALVFIGFAVVNLIAVSTSSAPAASDLFGTQPAWTSIVNAVLWLLAVLSFIAWLPGLIVGIVLIATKK